MKIIYVSIHTHSLNSLEEREGEREYEYRIDMCECVLQSIPSIINADSSYNLTFTYAQTHQTKIEMARKETRTRSHNTSEIRLREIRASV